MKKYELTSDYITFMGLKLFRIKALIDFGNVEAGELGGYIEKENNLDHGGNAWVYSNARVYGGAKVHGNAEVYSNAKVHGNAEVYDNAEVCGDADYTTIKGFGIHSRNTTFFKCKDGKTKVSCGCFFGHN